ncbi:MAG: PCMD domain-containing protein [Rikenellaceae bacterium]|nr:PCMD domain-containing protein [Rikenellaceae bacterium]
MKAKIALGMMLVSALPLYGQEKMVPIAFGDMNQWVVRKVKESGIIGGNTVFLYEVGKSDTLLFNTPYVPQGSPWATSNVLAKVSGVSKGSVTVFPEKRGDGYCARLETRIDGCKVLGLFSITVLSTGTAFLGVLPEPVKDARDPQSKLVMGIPFTERLKALVFDYKFEQGRDGGKRWKISGTGRDKELEGTNAAEVQLLLQSRWEDPEGNVYAKRVGTAWQQYSQDSPEWVNGHRMTVEYGDITDKPFFEPYMGLTVREPQFTINSKGERVPIQEVGWDASAPITHLILRFSSGYGGAFVGCPGSKFWIDNVKLVY